MSRREGFEALTAAICLAAVSGVTLDMSGADVLGRGLLVLSLVGAVVLVVTCGGLLLAGEGTKKERRGGHGSTVGQSPRTIQADRVRGARS